MSPLGSFAFVLAFLLGLSCLEAQPLKPFNIDKSAISVSGVSSGGAFAIQFHVGYSSQIMGMAAIAAPPYFCANANLAIALSSCMMFPSGISVEELWAATTMVFSAGTIDNPKNMANSKVWLFSGTQDSIVNPGVVRKSEEYYLGYQADMKTVYNISAEHSFVTDNFGNQCSYFGSPYINNCHFDSSASFFSHFYGKLNPKGKAKLENYFNFSQVLYTPANINPSTFSMADLGIIYVPTFCQNKTQVCKLHFSFHGCDQTVSDIQADYYTKTGLNDWAETNNIIVIYPQLIHAEFPSFNPQGCWDWWGYTGPEYPTQLGPQMRTVNNMLNAVTQ
jgi:hypothetical protein